MTADIEPVDAYVADMSRRLAATPGRWATPDPSTLSKLPKPTSRSNDKGHCNVCGGWHGLPAVHLDYMGHADVTLALIEVDPLWTWEPVAFDPATGGPIIGLQGGRLVMWARLTVLGKTMLGVGTCESGKGDPEKELIGDFLRNAAMRFGIATKLWSKADKADPAGTDAGGGYDRSARAPRAPGPVPTRAPKAAPGDTRVGPPYVEALAAACGKGVGYVLVTARNAAKDAGMDAPTSTRDVTPELAALVAARLNVELRDVGLQGPDEPAPAGGGVLG